MMLVHAVGTVRDVDQKSQRKMPWPNGLATGEKASSELSLDSDKTHGISYTKLYNVSGLADKKHYLFFVVYTKNTC
jgi:hypothetical protein